ncbi:MAG TPA: hypothetical protein VGN72_07485 [Tepidisphaeraceae bacterium]|nr:hypothetical protein [Tepidisphaeraceae bacterium]
MTSKAKAKVLKPREIFGMGADADRDKEQFPRIVSFERGLGIRDFNRFDNLIDASL